MTECTIFIQRHLFC